MGAVFVAKHTVMGRDAVIKLLKPELSHDEEMVRRFFNEARTTPSISSPGHRPDLRRRVLERSPRVHRDGAARGETLRAARTRAMPIEQAVHVLRLLARTLEAAHERGIVHRDLKPDNIFLVPDRDIAGGERTKILDFGIAKLAGGNTQHHAVSGSIFGTPAYMAPEQCTDSGNVDARADLYAIGCIAYEMLCGQPPFGLGGLELLAAHLRDTPVPVSQKNPSVPLWLGAVVNRLLRKGPADRYLSAAELYAGARSQCGHRADAGPMTPRPLTPLPTPPPSFPRVVTRSRRIRPRRGWCPRRALIVRRARRRRCSSARSQSPGGDRRHRDHDAQERACGRAHARHLDRGPRSPRPSARST